jgi:surfeit locus 1 family protein
VTRRGGKRAALLILALLATGLFTALGVWQVNRREWKLDLIARVTARVNVPAAPLPSPATWPSLNDRDDSYRHVTVRGVFLNDRETLVQALTELGAGYWVLAPLRTADGTILINRGFVPPEKREPAKRQAGQSSGPVTVTGLLRMTEPEGSLLRSNNPATDRWYSRDVVMIARKRGLTQVAPFFIDADSMPNPGGYPVGGLTIVTFRNAHLIYAVTWFMLAALSAAGAFLLLRHPTRTTESAR